MKKDSVKVSKRNTIHGYPKSIESLKNTTSTKTGTKDMWFSPSFTTCNSHPVPSAMVLESRRVLKKTRGILIARGWRLRDHDSPTQDEYPVYYRITSWSGSDDISIDGILYCNTWVEHRCKKNVYQLYQHRPCLRNSELDICKTS